jgi:hypothetical protein
LAQSSSSRELALSSEANGLIEFKQMKERQLQTEGNGLGSNPFMRQGVAQNYDSSCLSNEDCYVALKVSIPFDGIFKIEKLIGRNDTPADDFYCEQAVWEFAINMGGKHGPGEVLCEFFGKPNSGSGIHSELKSSDSNRVFLHLIPQQFSLSNLVNKHNKLAAPENVVSIDVTKLNSPRLSQFRRDWLQFLFLPPDPSLPYGPTPILKKRDEMKKSYEELFTPEKK